jgi:putative transposase
MQRILRFVTDMIRLCLRSLHHRFVLWTKPDTPSLIPGMLIDLARSKSELVAENAFLRQQLIILRRQVKRPACTKTDRMLLVLLARMVRIWKQALFIVQPETLLHWHRQGFKLFWKYKSRAASLTPRISQETISLIEEMARDNRLWGAERIRGELLKLGIHVCKRTIQKYMRAGRTSRPGGQTWRTFIHTHAQQIWACDFLPVTDLFFRSLFVFFIIELKSRKVIHVGVTHSPTDVWTAQQLREATAYGVGPKYLIRDNDSKFGVTFARVAKTSHIEILKTPYHAPRVVFSVIITPVSFTSSPSSLRIFPSMISLLGIRSWRRNKRQTNGYAGGIGKHLLQEQRDSCWKGARGGRAMSASWRRKKPSWCGCSSLRPTSLFDVSHGT